MLTETSVNRITGIIIAAAIAVHRALGPGLLESAYITCLIFELHRRGLKVEEQRPVPLTYCGVKLDCAYRLDLVVENQVIVDVKALEKFAPLHTAQMLTYLRLTGYAVGLLLNFNAPVLKEGLKRVLNTKTTGDREGEQPSDRR